MNIQPASFATPHPEQTARTAPAKAEEKLTAAVRIEQDIVDIGNAKNDKPVTYSPPKKLTEEQLRAIKESMSAQQSQLLQAMAGNSINQANSFLTSVGQNPTNWLNNAVSGGNSNGKLPPLATTQEGALAAISEGGAYSVDAVATRIFDMAKSMAGDNPEMLKKMQAAVEKGFEAAGVDFKKATGKGLPDISSKTHDEIMSRFEKRFEELGVKTGTSNTGKAE